MNSERAGGPSKKEAQISTITKERVEACKIYIERKYQKAI
jgi:hypothetical protein